MTETLHYGEPLIEMERRKHLRAIEDYVAHGAEDALQEALDFFDGDPATLMHFLNYLGQKFNVMRSAEQPSDRTQMPPTPAARLLDLRDIYTPPR